MINILIHFAGAKSKIEKASKSEDTPFAYIKEGRMNNVYSLFLKDKEAFIEIRKKIKKLTSVTIIGGWNRQGKFITLPNASDNFTRSKFKARMKKFVRHDENGNEIENRDYTDEELTNGVINQIYGHPPREF